MLSAIRGGGQLEMRAVFAPTRVSARGSTDRLVMYLLSCRPVEVATDTEVSLNEQLGFSLLWRAF